MVSNVLTGKPSVDKPWLKYYPQQLLDYLQVPDCTLTQYFMANIPGMDVPAIHYYGNDICWSELFAQAERIARALRAAGFGEGDQVPVLIQSVPEYVPILMAVEKIGASLLIRDNEIHENAQAVRNSGAKYMITHSYLSLHEMDVYLESTDVEKIILLDPCNSCRREDMPEHILKSLDANYTHPLAQGDAIMSWEEFLAMGDSFEGKVEAPVDVNRPLIRCYTSGSTGPSKQVIHSAHTIVGVLVQMNFYGDADFRPNWLLMTFPPSLIAAAVAMLLLPLASNKLLIMDPWADPDDVDLEMMRCKPNTFPMVPMYVDNLINSTRIPADYDMSHLLAGGAGSEAYNNTQLANAQAFFDSHNCKFTFTTGYGSSEAGSNIGFHVAGYPMGNGNVGCPMPLSTVSIFKPGTTEELSYNMYGEICTTGPGVMLGYDNVEQTSKTLRVHEDGKVWLHTGDIGRMDENGVIFTASRGSNKRYGSGFLDILTMENRVADARIEGIHDQFFVNIPDETHPGYFVPYLYVVLKPGYELEDLRPQILATLEPHMIPAHMEVLDKRPYWHFKTNRIGLTKKVLAERKAAAV